MSTPKINLNIELTEENIKELFKKEKISLQLEIKLKKEAIVMSKKDMIKAIAMK